MKKSKLFLFLLIFFILGIALHSFIYIPFFFIYLFFLVALAVLIIGWPSEKIRIMALGGIFLFLGILRYHLSLPQINEGVLQFYNNQGKISFTGIVSEEPDWGNNFTKLVVSATKLIEQEKGIEKSLSGKVLLKTNLYPAYRYGEELKIICSLIKPEKIQDFDYERYLSRYNIYSLCYYPQIELISQNQGNRVYALILGFKSKLKSVIISSLSEPQASVLSALILGLRQGIPQKLVDNFSQTGTSHIMAISGLHITIISAIFMSLLIGLGLSRPRAFYLAILFLILYITMIGFPPSAIRAGLMGSLVLLAMKLGRLNRATNALVLAGSLILLVNPKILRGDIGFQLSFLSVVGLIFILPFLEKWLEKFPEGLGVKSSVGMTLSAQIMTFPLIVFNFHRLSFIAPLSNILILPLLPFILISGFIASIFGLICLPLGKILFLPVWLLTTYLIKVVEISASLPFSFLEIKNWSGVFLLVFYSVITFLVWKFRKINKFLNC